MKSEARAQYETKLSTYENVIKGIGRSARIASGNSSAKSHGFFNALSDHGSHIEDLILAITNTYEDGYEIIDREGVRVFTAFYGPRERALIKNGGHVDYRPTQFCDGPRFMATGMPGPDVYVITTGPMDEEGYFNHGLSAGNECASIERYGPDPGTLVVIEANARMPHLYGMEEFGGHRFHISQVDRVIEIDEPVRVYPRDVPSELDKRLAGYVAEIVEDGSTVQFGIGALPDMVAERLREKRDLGIHTEMLGDGCMELIQSGAVTNEKKTEHRGLSIATFAWGSPELYEWAERNETFRLLPIMQVNYAPVLARQYKMTSINSILQVDLRGQATAHCLAGKTYSGLGGHFEHTFGAQLSPGGKSILCLRSSADLKGGRVSNILPVLAEGTAITVPEFIIDWIVTEYGAVHLKWLSLDDRAHALISIAHPDFRDELTEQAERRGMIRSKVSAPK